MFDKMIHDIKEDTVRQVLSVRPKTDEAQRKAVVKVTATGGSGEPAKRKPVVANKKVGRNDPCPCGSGKKYKKCCGADGTEA